MGHCALTSPERGTTGNCEQLRSEVSIGQRLIDTAPRPPYLSAMPAADPRIDAYIEKAQPFAQPILRHLRALVHEACPDVEETIKWGMPHFGYQGGMMCSMAAFKAHCAFGFWHSDALLGARSRNAEAMGDFGRITALADLPSRTRITTLVKRAMKLNETGVKRAARPARAATAPKRSATRR